MNQQKSAERYLILFAVLLAVNTAAFAEESAEKSKIQADNTGKNVRDRNLAELTPINQSNDRNDMAITQDIRKMLIQDKTLSMNAKNIKVITRKRTVTLRGAVNTMVEKATVEQIALSVAGIGKVRNKVEVITN